MTLRCGLRGCWLYRGNRKSFRNGTGFARCLAAWPTVMPVLRFGFQDGACNTKKVAYNASSFCICVTTSLTRPRMALWTSEGLRVSVIPVHASSPSGAAVT